MSNLVKPHQISSNLVKRCQTSSNLIKRRQTWSNIVKRREMSSNLVKHCQTSWNVVKLCQFSSNFVKHHRDKKIQSNIDNGQLNLINDYAWSSRRRFGIYPSNRFLKSIFSPGNNHSFQGSTILEATWYTSIYRLFSMSSRDPRSPWPKSLLRSLQMARGDVPGKMKLGRILQEDGRRGGRTRRGQPGARAL